MTAAADARRARISEPTTMLTDYLLAIVASAGALLLLDGTSAAAARSAWGVAFAATALGSATGGTVHGFAEYLGALRTERLWRTTLVLVALASAAMLVAMGLALAASTATGSGLAPAGERSSGAAGVVLIAVAIVKLAVVLAFVVRRAVFRDVLADHALTLLLITAVLGVMALREGTPAFPWILGGVVATAVGGVVQWRGLAPHRHFNHNDLFHVIQLGALLLFLRGGLLLGG